MAGNGNGFFKGFLFGSLLGVVAGVLLAPRSGKEIREGLGEETEKFYKQTKSDLDIARKAAMKSFEEGRDRIIEKLGPNDSTEPVEQKEPKKRTRKPKPKTT
jgi:gas vesicle protein